MRPLPDQHPVVRRHGKVGNGFETDGLCLLPNGFHIADGHVCASCMKPPVEFRIAGTGELAAFVKRPVDGEYGVIRQNAVQELKKAQHLGPRHDV